MALEPTVIAKLVVTNRGGIADSHQLRLIEASEMYAGLHRAISYCLLSHINGQLVETATQNAPVQIYQRRTFDNCVSHELIVGAVGGGAGNLLSATAIALLTFCFQAGLGKMKDREYEERLRLFKRIEPFAEDLINHIEPQLAQIHRPIHEQETIEIKFDATNQVHLDLETKDYVSDSVLTSEATTYTGNVTRLNVVTGNGRFYASELGYIIPFSQPANFKASQLERPLSWSLREADKGLPANIQIDARQFTSMSGRLKRLLVVASRNVPDDDDI